MLFPAGFTFRIRSTGDAESVSERLDVTHVRRDREITLTEAAILTPASQGQTKPEKAQAVAVAWERIRRTLASQGILNVPPDLLPLARAIEGLTSAL